MDIEVTTDRDRVDVAMVHGFLSESYWATGRTYECVERSIDNSLPFSAFVGGTQVGFGRVITDFAVFAYLADVFVLPSHRGRGVSRAIMDAVVAHPDLQGLKLFWLATRDAHGLYEKYGFTRLTDPGKFMAILGPEAPRFSTDADADAADT